MPLPLPAHNLRTIQGRAASPALSLYPRSTTLATALSDPNQAVRVVTPRSLSWSSVSSYSECGLRWLLERRLAPPANFHWLNTVGGSALHSVTEIADRTSPEDAPSFESVLVRLLSELPPRTRIRVSGSKRIKLQFSGGPNKQDLEWWLTYGPQMVEQWQHFREESGWAIAIMPDGSPGIELDFEIRIAGVPVRGSIDRVMLAPEGEIVIVDIKGGRTSAVMQLATYAYALKEVYGLEAEWATFWQPRLEDEKHPIGKFWREHMPSYPWVAFEEMYANAQRGIEAGIFLPNVGQGCAGCTIKDSCWANQGAASSNIPRRVEMVPHVGQESCEA